MAPTKKVLFRVVGALAAVGVVVLLAGTWWVSSLYQSEQTDTAHASAAFAEVRARFPGLEPAFEIREARLVAMREPTAAPSLAPPAAAHMLVWQPSERVLSRVTLPLWMSKVATEPLPLEALAGVANQGLGGLLDAKRRGHELNIRISDLERYGRTLLLDGVTTDGKRVIARCREILGHEADGLSDVDVDQMRRHADAMANVIVEIFLEQRAPQE